jgi:hypothetical protein
MEAIEKSLKEAIEDIQKATGATDEEMRVALGVCARDFMDANFMVDRKS